MKPEVLLYDLNELGENYSKMTAAEQQQYILDTINEMLDTENLKTVLLRARSLIYGERLDESKCPLCATELQFKIISSDSLEAWGKNVMTEEKIPHCPNCDWGL